MTDHPPVHPAAELFPLLEGEQLRELADDIRANGLIEPVWLYDDPEQGTVLLDGRNRAAACELAGVEVRTRYYRGDDPITFSISQNMKRRHLTTGQKAFVALKAEPLYAAEAKKRMLAGKKPEANPGADPPQGSQDDLDPIPKLSEEDSTALRAAGEAIRKNAHALDAWKTRQNEKRAPRARDRAAATTGTSGRRVAQAKRIEQQAPDLAAQVLGGEMALDRAERIIRDREAEQRRVEQARQEAAAGEQETRVDIRHGDFREALADLTGVDAIITDPPYPAEFLPLLDDLAAWADKVLTPDGVLAVLIGQTYLPEVYRRLEGHRPYRWTGCYITSGAGYVSHPRKAQSNWKPLLIYGGGPRFVDVVRSEGADANAKALHKWGQDYSAFHTIIERLTTRGQTVADPFMGSGTTLLAAHALGRHAVGADVDAEHVETARERLS